MTKLIKWWIDLPWYDKSYDEVKEGTKFERKKPLTFKELFFRDKVAVIGNFFPLLLLIFYILWGFIW